MRFVPQPVMAGFVNALAILIFLAQLPQLGLDVFHPEQVVVAWLGDTSQQRDSRDSQLRRVMRS